MVYVTVNSVRIDDITTCKSILLLEKQGNRTLTIPVGDTEAVLISLAINDMLAGTPYFLYNVFLEYLTSKGDTVTAVHIRNSDDGVIFEAELTISGAVYPVRPTDCIIMGALTNTDITVDTLLFDKYSVKNPEFSVSLEDLSFFKDVLEELDI